MRTLRELYLKNNRISRIYPEAFANMTNLRDLQLSGNRIVSVPLLTGIPALLRLYLDNNEIKTISYSFIKLPHLSELSVSYTDDVINRLTRGVYRLQGITFRS